VNRSTAAVRAAQLRAVVSVNRELILLYWDIGKIIAEAQKTKGYGKQVVERLADDLQKEFPGTAGFSPQMLRAKSLTINVVADVAGFPDLHINLACRAPSRGDLCFCPTFLPFPN
jgi:hypothetical protein